MNDQMGLAHMRGTNRRGRLMAVVAAVVPALAVLPGCGTGPAAETHPPYSVNSVQSGFLKPGEIDKDMVQFKDSGHGSHVIYTPPNSVPTCPYVQRSDDVKVQVQPAVELVGGNPTGRFIVGPRDQRRATVPSVTQGAVVFTTDALADEGMRTVTTEAAKCPGSFSILGGPPVIVGTYKVNRRPFKSDGWTGFTQQLTHTSPPDLSSGTYDDLATIVAHRANTIIYVGYTQVQKTGHRADSGMKLEKLMKTALGRLG
jgi:hypothetical protein